MNQKNLKKPVIIITIGLIVAVLAYLLTGILKTPTVSEHDFNYSATYKLNGETKTLEGVYRVQFESTGEGIAPLDRYYKGFYLSDPSSSDPKEQLIAEKDNLELRVVFIFTDDYLMGDGDIGEEYSEAMPEPYLAVFDDEGYEYTDPEMLEKFKVELISYETPQPIENSFAFAGFSILHSGSMMAMLLVGLLVVFACAILVKPDESVTYTALDKLSFVMNCIIGFGAISFITLVAYLMGTYVGGDELSYQATLCLPALTAFTVAASLSLRRKGFAKTGFAIQFVGPALFVLFMILDTLF